LKTTTDGQGVGSHRSMPIVGAGDSPYLLHSIAAAGDSIMR
jgi:hypothetical protein